MGDIDIDPATDERVQKRIKAKVYHIDTPEKDAFKFEWYGRLYLNPPYRPDLVPKFILRVIEQYQKGNVTEAIMQCHTMMTYEPYFDELLRICKAICFHTGPIKWWKGHLAEEVAMSRIGFNWKPEGYTQHGNSFSYLGPNMQRFCEVFARFGRILVPWTTRTRD